MADQFSGLEERARALGIKILERRIKRLEGRNFLWQFFRIKWLLRKIRILRGE